MKQNKKQNKIGFFLGLGLSALGLLFLVSCGGSSNALKDYKNVNLVPKHDTPSPVQFIDHANPFSVMVEGPGTSSYGQFIEGSQSRVSVRVIINNRQITGVSLEIVDFPYNDVPQVIQSTKEQNVFDLVWTPKIGTIERGRYNKDFEFKVAVKSTSLAPGVEAASELVRETRHAIFFNVSKSNEIPKIIGSNIPKIGEEGNKIRFNLLVNDPNFRNIGLPEVALQPYRSSNTEAFRADAVKYINALNVTKVAADTFQFNYELDLTMPLPEMQDRRGNVNPNAAIVPMCFIASAISVEQILSSKNEYCIDVKYATQPAVMKWLTEDRRLVAGQTKDLQFELSTKNGLSQIEVKNIENQLRGKLSGNSDLKCEDINDNKNSIKCTLTWEPATWRPDCGDKNIKKFNFKITVTSSLNGKSKNKSFETPFEVVNSEENCPIARDNKNEQSVDEKVNENKTESQS